MPKITYKTDEERKAARKATLRRYYLKNRERIIAQTNAWSKKNSVIVSTNLRNWRKRNSERFKASEKKWREKNIEKARKIGRESYARHAEARKKQHQKWSRDNPDRTAFHGSLRRKRCKLHPDANKKLIAAVYCEARRISRATGIKHVVDHIIPVHHKGWHHEDNLQPMTKAMNGPKHNKPFWLAPHMGIKDWRDVPRHLWPEKLAPKYAALIEQHKGETIRWDTAA